MRCQKETSSCHIFIYYERATYSKIVYASEGEFDLLDLCRSQRFSKEAFAQNFSWWLFKGLHNLSDTKFPHHRAESSLKKKNEKAKDCTSWLSPKLCWSKTSLMMAKYVPDVSALIMIAISNDSKKNLGGRRLDNYHISNDIMSPKTTFLMTALASLKQGIELPCFNI